MANNYPPSNNYVQSLAISLNGTDWYFLPPFWDYKMTSSTLVNSGRNTDGIMVGSIIREGVRKIEVGWKYLDRNDFSYVAKLFESSNVGGNGGFMFYVKYFDTIRNALIDSSNDVIISGQPAIQRKFYVGDRITDTAKIKLDSNGYPIGYENIKLSLIEC